MMLRFAVKEGLEPDEALRRDIATLDHLLVRAGLKTISETPPQLVALKQTPSTGAAKEPVAPEETGPPKITHDVVELS
jgi:hypothetical protein